MGVTVHNGSRSGVTPAQPGVIVTRIPDAVPMLYDKGTTRECQRFLFRYHIKLAPIPACPFGDRVVVPQHRIYTVAPGPHRIQYVTATDIAGMNRNIADRNNLGDTGIKVTVSV